MNLNSVSSESSDLDLIKESKKGNNDAKDLLFRRYEKFIRTIIKKKVFYKELSWGAWDVSVDCFYKTIDAFDCDKYNNFGRYLNFKLNYMLHNYIKIEKNRKEREALMNPFYRLECSSKKDVHLNEYIELNIRNEQSKNLEIIICKLRECIDALKEKEQLVVEDHHFNGIKLVSIAERLSLTKGRISQIKANAYLSLVKCMEEYRNLWEEWINEGQDQEAFIL